MYESPSAFLPVPCWCRDQFKAKASVKCRHGSRMCSQGWRQHTFSVWRKSRQEHRTWPQLSHLLPVGSGTLTEHTHGVESGQDAVLSMVSGDFSWCFHVQVLHMVYGVQVLIMTPSVSGRLRWASYGSGHISLVQNGWCFQGFGPMVQRLLEAS